jgi:hypothetical protein
MNQTEQESQGPSGSGQACEASEHYSSFGIRSTTNWSKSGKDGHWPNGDLLRTAADGEFWAKRAVRKKVQIKKGVGQLTLKHIHMGRADCPSGMTDDR